MTVLDHKTTGGRIAVAMSGGVDSSVAAGLLLEQGHAIVGVTLRLRPCEEARGSRSCCGIDGVTRAREVADRLAVPHYVLDCVSEFGEQVLRPAWEEYAAGRTPSPCLLCNERIKFGLLLEWVRRLGLASLATGHYARVEPRSDNGRPALLRALDADKDQSYFLAGLSLEQLASVRFPVGGLRKPEVRERARGLGLPNADTPDSQDACLVDPDRSFAEMLRQRFDSASRPGAIVDSQGAVLGRHPGLHHFTVGQRRGLGAVASPHRCWVKSLRTEDAAVIVTTDESELLAGELTATSVSWLDDGAIDRRGRCRVQIRYRHAAVPATVEKVGSSSVRVIFDEPVRAVTPGQAAVFYDGARVLGRGWIAG